MTTRRRSILDRVNAGPPPAIALGQNTFGPNAFGRKALAAQARQAPAPAPAAGPNPNPNPNPNPAPARAPATAAITTLPRVSLRKRFAVLLAVITVPAMAATGDFGAVAGDAPVEPVGRDVMLAAQSAHEFEQPGMSFPGSAFYYLADPPAEALVALPDADPNADPLTRGAQGGREVGALIDAGPAASPFLAALSGTSHARAQDCLAQAVWYEAASESEAGQRAVAQVVLNRVAHPAWPASVCGVVYQGAQRSTGCQFTFTCDGSLARKASGATWARAKRIASEALGGSVYAPIGHATHYHTLWVDPYWASSLDPVGTIGAHRFYRNRGRSGEKAAFSTRHAGFEPSAVGKIPTPASAFASTDESAAAANPAPVAAAALPGLAAQAQSQAQPNALPERLADPALTSAGQAREAFSKAGQWKVDPAQLDLRAKSAAPSATPAARPDR